MTILKVDSFILFFFLFSNEFTWIFLVSLSCEQETRVKINEKLNENKHLNAFSKHIDDIFNVLSKV